MPIRRFVTALAVLLLGTLGLGVVTAVQRAGDDGRTVAGPSPSPSGFVPEPTDTPEPEPAESPAEQPSESPVPTGTSTGAPGSGNGAGEGPRMPSTGGPAGLPVAALALAGLAGLAVAVRRSAPR